LPPMMGWTGATNSLSMGAYLLGLILFLWQVPHFLSLAWLYRDEYAKAGFRMLPVVDPTGRMTCKMIVLYSLAMLPLGLVVATAGLAGYLFAAVSIVLGMGFFLLTLKLHADKSPQNARRVFLASLLYLPALMLFLVIDATPQHGETIAGRVRPSETGSLAALGDVVPRVQPLSQKPIEIVAAGNAAKLQHAFPTSPQPKCSPSARRTPAHTYTGSKRSRSDSGRDAARAWRIRRHRSLWASSR